MPRQQRNSADSDTSTTTQGVQHAVVSLDGLTPHPRNYRRHPESQVARLSASLARFGQVRSIVVQEGADGRYLIVAGHGLVDAARERGLSELRADVIPPTWTPAQVEGYLIADNETTRGADDDLVALAQLLEEQQGGGFDLDALGYSQEELAALLENLAQAAAGDWDDALGDLPDGDKAPFQQMTFTLTDAQASLVKRALDEAKDDAPTVDESGNANSNGNALAHLASAFLREAVDA